MKSRLLGAACACLFTLVTTLSNAAQVNYILEGDWFLFSGTDDYSLDGAHFRWTITAETNSKPIRTSADANGSLIAFYEAVSSQIAFSNRSNGAADTIATGTFFNDQSLITTNASIGSGRTDIFQTDTYYLDGEFSGLAVTQFSINFTDDFYFEGGFAPLPENVDFTEAIAASWGGLIDDSPPIRYGVSSWSMSVQPIPIPPAVWLFGSGLIGLIGVARKRRIF